jgi:hypothetical protein
MMDSSPDAGRDAVTPPPTVVERAQAARRRTAEVLAVSADLAERHAQRAEASGDRRRADYERDLACRARATVQRLREDPLRGA